MTERLDDATRDVGVVIVAAGAGTRTASSELKQFRWIAGKPMLLHSVQLFQARPDVAMVVCVLPKSHVGDPPPWLFQSDLDRLLISVGGRERTQSVRNGLEDLPPEVQYVAVHDAARPLVEPDTVERVIAQARAGTGAIAAIPASDTLKEVAADGRVERTIDRSAIWRVQTPQAFPRAMIDDVYRRAAQDRVSATDDAALCERYGYPVVVVRGSEMGMKVTEESDFAVLEALATAREART